MLLSKVTNDPITDLAKGFFLKEKRDLHWYPVLQMHMCENNLFFITSSLHFSFPLSSILLKITMSDISIIIILSKIILISAFSITQCHCLASSAQIINTLQHKHKTAVQYWKSVLLQCNHGNTAVLADWWSEGILLFNI